MKGKHEPGFWHTAKTATGVSLTTTYGLRNATRIAEFEGLAGNRKEASWNGKLHQHNCCGAKVSWRHKVNCPRIIAKENI